MHVHIGRGDAGVVSETVSSWFFYRGGAEERRARRRDSHWFISAPPRLRDEFYASPARQTAFSILRKVQAGGYASDLLLAGDRGAGFARCRAGVGDRVRRAAIPGAARLPDRTLRRLPAAARCGSAHRAAHGHLPASLPGARSGACRGGRKRGAGEARAASARAAGFVNAILRKVDREPVAWPNREIELSCPEWLLARWERHYGAEAAAGNRPRGAAAAGKVLAPGRAAAFRISGRNPSCRCWSWSRASRFSTFAPRPATRRRRRWKPASKRWPATSIFTAWRK